MNENDKIPIILNDVFNERKQSIIQTFKAIFEKILHDQSNKKISSIQEIERIISNIMNSLFTSEQEQFLSYLIYSKIVKIEQV